MFWSRKNKRRGAKNTEIKIKFRRNDILVETLNTPFHSKPHRGDIYFDSNFSQITADKERRFSLRKSCRRF